MSEVNTIKRTKKNWNENKDQRQETEKRSLNC